MNAIHSARTSSSSMLHALERIEKRLTEEYRQTFEDAKRHEERRRLEIEEELTALARTLDFWRRQP